MYSYSSMFVSWILILVHFHSKHIRSRLHFFLVITPSWIQDPLLPAISKILEQIFIWSIIILFNDSRFLFDHGFWLKHSTQYVALKLIDRIITQLDKDEKPIHVYLDLSKSFETIDHIILLDKLKYCGVHGTNLNLFSSYPEIINNTWKLTSNQICYQ